MDRFGPQNCEPNIFAVPVSCHIICCKAISLVTNTVVMVLGALVRVRCNCFCFLYLLTSFIMV